MSHILGVDFSLTSTGIATIHTGDGREHHIVDRIKSTGSKTATLTERNKRLTQLACAVHSVAHTIDGEPADLVVIEGPSFGQARQGGQHDRAGLWWLAVSYLIDAGLPVAEVAPASRAKYATGKGNAAKDAVLAAVVRRYPDVDVTGNDEADALILAAMGARHLGHPIEAALPQQHLVAMDAVRWPAVNSEREIV